jgi:hypothetical protein
MVPPTQGIRVLRRYDRPFLRLALIGALAAALGLAACGRKGRSIRRPAPRLKVSRRPTCRT